MVRRVECLSLCVSGAPSLPSSGVRSGAVEASQVGASLQEAIRVMSKSGIASRTKEISEGTTLAWAQLFRPAGHAGQRSFAKFREAKFWPWAPYTP